MNTTTKHKTLLTGATGGIGRAIALRLAEEGRTIAAVGRDLDALENLRGEIEEKGGRCVPLQTDLGRPEGVAALGSRALEALGGLDEVIHCAGVCSFAVAAEEDPEVVSRLFQVNVVAPIQITEDLLPHFLGRGQGTIVNVGSIFGSIGFAHFASYSATKFALRGWSEALRRELADSEVRVVYVAPRATRTPMARAFDGMAQAVGMKLDTPERVAKEVHAAMERGTKERFVGFPEGLFVRVNALLPRLVDKALRGQDRKARGFASRNDDVPSLAREARIG